MANDFTESEIVNYKAAFDVFDANKDGRISIHELRLALKAVGHRPTEAKLREVMDDLDVDESGDVDFSEFLLMVIKTNKNGNSQEELLDAFRTIDKNGDGFITAAELRHVVRNLRQSETDEEVDEMIREADIDGDGKISYQEFIQMMMSN